MNQFLGQKRQNFEKNTNDKFEKETDIEYSYIDLLDLLQEQLNNKNMEAIQTSIAVVNLNLSQEEFNQILENKYQTKLIKMIIFCEILEIKTNLLIFLNQIFDKVDFTVNLTEEEFNYFIQYISNNFQLNYNSPYALLFIKQIFTLFGFLNFSSQNIQQFLIGENFQQIFLGMQIYREKVSAFNEKIYLELYKAFYEFLNIFTENENIVKNQKLMKEIINTWFKNYDQIQMNDQIDLMNYQFLINLVNNKIDITQISQEDLIKISKIIYGQSLTLFYNQNQNFQKMKNELFINFTHLQNQIIFEEFEKIEFFIKILGKIYEGPFLDILYKIEPKELQNNTENLISQIVNTCDWKIDQWEFISQNLNNEGKSTKQILKFINSQISNSLQLFLNIFQLFNQFEFSCFENLVNFLWIEFKKQSNFLLSIQNKKNNFNLSIPENLLKNLLILFEIQNSKQQKNIIFSQISLDELINMFHFYFTLKQQQDFVFLGFIIDLITSKLTYNLFLKETEEIKTNIHKLNEYIKNIFELTQEFSIFLKANILNLIFILYGDSDFDQIFYQNQFDTILKKVNSKLTQKINYNFAIQNHPRFQDLQEAVENLTAFINYKSNLFNQLQMNTKLLIFLISLYFCNKIQVNQEGPIWPKKFKQDFTEQVHYYKIINGSTKGTLFYNYDKKVYRIDRENGKFDRFCAWIYFLRQTPCSHFVSEGKRYLYFKEKNYCCMCCTQEQGCGVTKFDWMKTGQKIKEFKKDGLTQEIWKQQGMQENLMTIIQENQEMVKLEQGTTDIMDFDRESFTIYFEDSVFDLPKECDPNKQCQKVSLCSMVSKPIKKMEELQIILLLINNYSSKTSIQHLTVNFFIG